MVSLLLSLALFLPLQVLRAHESSDLAVGSLWNGAPRQTIIDMRAALGVHSGTTPSSRDQPGGVLIDEHATYGDNGAALQAWSVWMEQPLSSRSWVTLGLGTHADGYNASGHEGSVAIEALAVSHRRRGRDGRRWLFTFGRLSQAPLDWLNWHADSGTESVPSLLSDVFFARHRVDTGFSVGTQSGGTRIGISAWQGEAWPAGNRQGSVDLSAGQSMHRGELMIDTTAFVSAARAEERGGTSAHDHDESGDLPVFTGDSIVSGVALTVSPENAGGTSWAIQAAVLESRERGDLSLDAREVALDSNHLGFRVHAEITRAARKDPGAGNTASPAGLPENHGLWVRHEWLLIDNHLSGPGGQLMAQAASLADVAGNPSRLVIGAWWQILPSLRWQLAVQREDDGSETAWRGLISLQWQTRHVLEGGTF